MKNGTVTRRTWKDLVTNEAPLVLPAAHDALTALLIERAGFPAYQVGGFAVDGARYGYPDIDLTHYGEKSAAVRDILHVATRPVLVDGDDGYGDAKNVTRTVRGYEAMGASAIFLEDQKAPKECGHMDNKKVIPADEMVRKLRAALDARRDPHTFILARTDARAPLGLDEAIRRAELYLDTGVDGVYIEGPTSVRELQRVGRAFRGVPVATSILENGGKTPWVSPAELHKMGFSMLLYPTTVLFRVARATEKALADLRAGKPVSKRNAVTMDEFEEIVGSSEWHAIEKRTGQQ